jgi:hypothetical protein
MEQNTNRKEHGQSIVLVAVMLLFLLLFAVIAVDLAYGYVHRRGDQNAADAASLAGARALADILNDHDGNLAQPPTFISEDSIQAAMNEFAERNGIEDTNGIPGDSVNTNVTGYYLDANGNRLQDMNGQPIVIGQVGLVPWAAQGVEAIANSVAPSFFGGIVGLDGLPINADAAVVFAGNVCSMNCIAPIATYTMTFQYAPACYNIWDGSRQQGGGGGGANACEGICQDHTCSNDPSQSCNNDNQCDFGACEDGTCHQNSNISCTPTGDVCSNDTSHSCHNNNQCNFGSCVGNQCSQNASVFCTSNADCVGTCGSMPGGWYCSGGSNDGNPCTGDDDCPGGYCEDGAGGSSSGLGWLNWSLQGSGHSCQDVGEPSDCSEQCLEYNLTPDTCLSGDIGVNDWVAGASGVKNANGVRNTLQWYIDTGTPMTVVVYDTFAGNGCNQNQNPGKLKYHVVGFAKFKVLGYELSQGSGSAYGHDGAGCVDWGMEGNRITGEFLGWVDGSAGDCDSNSTIVAPRVVR